jgi:hypothetical protein
MTSSVRNILVGVLLPAAQLFSQVGRLTPVDEAPSDSSLFVFRERLVRALNADDTTYLWAVVDTAIINGFAWHPGLEPFKQRYNQDPSLRSDLIKALTHGGVFTVDNLEFRAPYTHERFPSGLDTYEFGVITGSRVNVRRSSSGKSAVIRELNYSVVRVTDWYPKPDLRGNGWISVQLADSLTGFVSQQYIVSPIGLRLVLSKMDGRWQLTSWAAGD